MDAKKLEAKILDILVDQLGISAEEAKPETKLVDDLGCDDLDLIELVMEAENEFDIAIDDEQAAILERSGATYADFSTLVKNAVVASQSAKIEFATRVKK